MSLLEILALAIGLSMDAFAVSVCKGLSLRTIKYSHMLKAGLWFGIFQAGMPLLGFFLAGLFSGFIDQYDHWIAFGLLLLIGANMIREAFGKDEEVDSSMDIKTMLLLAVATSIDALAVGVSFAFLEVQIVPAVLIIGVITLVLSMAGIKLGSIFGAKYQKKAQLAGGIILILIGTKILLEGLGVF